MLCLQMVRVSAAKSEPLLTDKTRIHLRSASVRTYTFHHGIPKVLVNPQSKGITSA
jgi:hypothetical protein